MKFVLYVYTIQRSLHSYITISDRIFPAIRAHRRKLNVQYSSIRFNSIFSISLSRIWNGSWFEHVRWILWLIYDRQQPYLLNVSFFFLYPNLLDWQQQRQWAIYAFTKTGNNKTTAIKLCVLCLSVSLCSLIISNGWYAVKRQRIMATISSYFLSSISFSVSLACVEDSIPRLSSV